MENLSFVDWVIIGIFILSVIMGTVRGMVKELLSLLIWGLAAYIIINYSEAFVQRLPFLAEYSLTPGIKTIIAGIILLIITILSGGVIRYIVDNLVEFSGLEGTDKTLGAIFGLLRGFVIIMIIVTLVPNIFSVADAKWWKQSSLLPYFETFKQDAIAIGNAVGNLFEF